MEPGVPWQYTYNRLTAGVPGAVTNGELHHHLAAHAAAGNNLTAANNPTIPPTASQILLQASHGTSSAGHIWTSNVNYDNAFPPLFPNPKPAHLNILNAQRLTQAALNNQHLLNGSVGVTPYFDHQSSDSVSPAATLNWQSNNQLPSPFGVLPHENHSSSSPGPPVAKSSTKSFPISSCNSLNSNFEHGPANHSKDAMKSQPISPPLHSIPQTNPVNLNKSSISRTQSGSYYASDGNLHLNYDTTNRQIAHQQHVYGNSVNKNYSVSPISASPSTSTNISRPIVANSSPNAFNNNTTIVIKSEPCQRSPCSDQMAPGLILSHDKSCHTQHIETKAQTKIYPALIAQAGRHQSMNVNEQQQTIPISFSVNNSSEKASQPCNSGSAIQQPHEHSALSLSTYRHQYVGPENDMHASFRPKSNSVTTDHQQYPNNATQHTQHTTDCTDNTAVPGRPSPLLMNAQDSPLGYISSPSYPTYNSPMNSVASPQDQRQQRESHQTNNYKLTTPKSPYEIAQQSQQSVAYGGSVIQRVGDRNTPRPNNNEQQPTHVWHNDLYRNQLQHKLQPNLFNGIYDTTSALPGQQESPRHLPQNHMHNANPSFENKPGNNQQIETTAAKPAARKAPKKVTDKVVGSRKRKAKDKPVTKIEKKVIPLEPNSVPIPSTVENCHIRVPPPAHVHQHTQSSVEHMSNGTLSNPIDPERWHAHSYHSTKSISRPTNGQPSPVIGSSMDYHQQNQHLSIQHDTSLTKNSLPQFPPYQPLHNSAHPTPLTSNYYPQAFHATPINTNYVELSTVPAASPANSHLASTNHPTINHNLTPLSNQMPHNNQALHRQIADGNHSNPLSIPTTGRQHDDHPKVIVPNIEDELGFLDESNEPINQKAVYVNSHAVCNHNITHAVSNKIPETTKPPTINETNVFRLTPTGPTAGYMSSYLQFLQNDRDSSPPLLACRGPRKPTVWCVSKKAVDGATNISALASKEQVIYY